MRQQPRHEQDADACVRGERQRYGGHQLSAQQHPHRDAGWHDREQGEPGTARQGPQRDEREAGDEQRQQPVGCPVAPQPDGQGELAGRTVGLDVGDRVDPQDPCHEAPHRPAEPQVGRRHQARLDVLGAGYRQQPEAGGDGEITEAPAREARWRRVEDREQPPEQRRWRARRPRRPPPSGGRGRRPTREALRPARTSGGASSRRSG